MKVLIITYYWPPAGGSGVQRWLKIAKYLQDFGIEPVIYTVENASYPKEDASLFKDVPENLTILKYPIWEPTDLLFWKKKSSENKGIANISSGGFLSFVRGNFFVPDPKISWVKPSIKYLQKYLDRNTIDVVISSGPPHSMHLIAKKLKEKNNLKWLADFRDPWSNLYYNKDFKQLNFVKNKNLRLEQSVLKSADCVVTVSSTLKKEFAKFSNNVKVITNGFDTEIYDEKQFALDAKFSISYIGLLPKQSNPKILYSVLEKICLENSTFKQDLQLNFIGDICAAVLSEITACNLQNNTVYKGYVSHDEAIEYQHKSQVLLLLVPNVSNNNGILTGKLFEYLKAKRPILALGPENGELSDILNETKAGIVIDYKDKERLTLEILKLYKHFKEGSLKVSSQNIQKYHRKELTGELASILTKL